MLNTYFYIMLVQQILLAIIFLVRLFYMGYMAYRSFRTKSGCATGCGKCGSVDFAKIEQQMKKGGHSYHI